MQLNYKNKNYKKKKVIQHQNLDLEKKCIYINFLKMLNTCIHTLTGLLSLHFSSSCLAASNLFKMMSASGSTKVLGNFPLLQRERLTFMILTIRRQADL